MWYFSFFLGFESTQLARQSPKERTQMEVISTIWIVISTTTNLKDLEESKDLHNSGVAVVLFL